VIWVYYSGHGTQQGWGISSEEDGKNECICPTDCDEAGYIGDNWLNSCFAAKLPKGSQAVMMFDCCHSGTMIDLPYQYRKSDGGWERTRPANPNAAFVLYLSGCCDNQYSIESPYYAGIFSGFYKTGGALTTQFLSTAEKYGDNAPLKKYLDRIQSSSNLIDNGQEPCLSSSHRISVKQSFDNFLSGGVKIRKHCSTCDDKGTVPCGKSECPQKRSGWFSFHPCPNGSCRKACPTCEREKRN